MLKSVGFLQMSEEQQEAVTCGPGPVLISAGPGSGKTFTITHRIWYLIKEMGYSPQDIYVITFTKDAALSMNKRYQEILQESKEITADWGAVHFGTFHSFFYQIIRSHPKYKNYTLLNASGRSGILFDVQKKLGRESFSRKELTQALADISYFKNTGRLPDGCGEEFVLLVRAYDAAKEAQEVLDFDDMLTLCLQLLKEDTLFQQKWQERIGYLMVDEFQDTNPVQYETMKLLIKQPYNVCVVGDDDQAIYGFRGARPGIMQEFVKDYPTAMHYSLGTNYRCAEAVVKASDNLICNNKGRIHKLLQAKAEQIQGIVDIRGAENYSQMINECMEELKGCDEEVLTETAVLFRTNMRMNLFLVELIKNKIPFQTKEKLSSVYEHFVVKDVMDYLRAAAGCRERSLFLRILNKPRTHIGRGALLMERVDLVKVAEFYGKDGIRNYEAMKDALRFEKGLHNLQKLRLSLGVDFILHYFGYEAYLRNKSCGDLALYEEWMGIVRWMKEDSKNFRDLKQWEAFQQEYIGKAEKQIHAGEKTAGVNVMTLHSCKGLEFKQVYVMHVNEGNIPSIKKGEVLTGETLEEERRLFYVGITRAKEVLHIRYVKQTQENARPPSRFINELQN